MIRHDLSHWPLVVSVASGLSTLEEMDAFIQEWSHWLGRGEPFASLRVFADAPSLIHPDGSAQKAKHWLQDKGAAIREQVIGMANVVPASDYERMRKMNVEKLFGVPAGTFQDVPSALAWLRESVFAPRGLPFDEQAVAASIEAAVAAATARAPA
ncbi:hypothetical protein [Xylophilus sp. ASV27]|uniref:hypothetical protein n=1 Tax=Xylophilus sp. ASV27 TaxID=2795129 RepID=UPI0018EC96BC|nr:hypothetical protein [Xylophilus sp. ASV27]